MEEVAEPILRHRVRKTDRNTKSLVAIKAAIALTIILVIKIITYFPFWVETYYSTYFYRVISAFYRRVSGILPFSFGDILYLAAGLFLVWCAVKFITVLVKKRLRFVNYKRLFVKVFFIGAVVYIFFNISWGLNYNRLGISHQLKIKEEKNNIEDLKNINRVLVEKVNEERLALGQGKVDYPLYPQIFKEAQLSYTISSAEFPFLNYDTPSIKRSLYGRLGNFFGFLGYYNPFTGEAQLNLTMPRFLIPYVTCHEMAHQLGYASEDEANFVGYLAAVKSPNKLFHYSAYFDLFNYANNELYKRDSAAARMNYNQLDTLVKEDIVELRSYWRKSDNYIEPFIKAFYDQYLKANQQDKGVKSYNHVVSLLIAYNKKYGRI
jgi:hypothetical protein